VRRSNTDGGARLPGHVGECDTMEDFDALPLPLRAALRYTIVQRSARHVLEEVLPYAEQRYPGRGTLATLMTIALDESRVHAVAARDGDVVPHPRKNFRVSRLSSGRARRRSP
jgi:hypothetical protein